MSSTNETFKSGFYILLLEEVIDACTKDKKVAESAVYLDKLLCCKKSLISSDTQLKKVQIAMNNFFKELIRYAEETETK